MCVHRRGDSNSPSIFMFDGPADHYSEFEHTHKLLWCMSSIAVYNYWMISKYTLNNILREFAIST